MAKYDSAPDDPGDFLPEAEDGLTSPPSVDIVLPLREGIVQRVRKSLDPRERHFSINDKWLYDQNALRHHLSSD